MELVVVVALMAVASATTATLVFYGTKKNNIPAQTELMDQIHEVMKPAPLIKTPDVPSGKLELISMNASPMVRFFQTNDANRLSPTLAGTSAVLFDGTLQLIPGSNGRVEFRDSIGTTPKFSFNTVLGNFDVTGGDITVAGTITAMSDRRVKTDIEPIQEALQKVLKLEGVTYYMKSDLAKNKPMMGMIAQDVQEVAPELVQQNENGFFSVAYGNSSALLVEAIKQMHKEMTDEIRRLHIQIDELKEQQTLMQRNFQLNK